MSRCSSVLAGCVLFAFQVGCDPAPVQQGVPPISQPPGNNGCGDACQVPPPPVAQDLTDPIKFLSVGVDSFGGFFEPVEVKTWGDKVAMCTGVRGLTIYRAEEPCCLSHEISVIPDRSRNYPRCQHLEFVGDTVYITNHGDEILPDTFVSAVNLSDLDSVETIDTHLSDNPASFEGIAAREGVAYVAQHEAGVAVFRLEGDGALTFIRSVTTDLNNAWQPLLDPAGAFLYVADAGGALVVFDVGDPLDPQHIATLPAEGTLKDLAWLNDTVYAASGSAGVEIFDVSDPGAPVKAGRADTPGSALGVSAEGEHLIVADWNDVQLFNISNRLVPVPIGHQKAYINRRDAASPDVLGRILDATLKDGLIYMAEWAAPQVHQIVPGADAPDLMVSSTVEFPRTDPGQQEATGLAIWNRGRQPLVIESLEVDPPYSVSISGMTVSPGQRQLAEVVFDPTDPGPAMGTLTIRSNDPDEPTAEVQVRGNLQGLRPGDMVPDLTFTTLDGTVHRLSEARGHPVLLAYFATF